MRTAVLEPPQAKSITRREFVKGGAALGLLLAASCGRDDAHEASRTETEGGWSFTDDRGITASVASRPTRVVAYDTAASALWHLGIKPVGMFGAAREGNPALEGMELTGIESVGEVYGEVNLEKVAALNTDLVVTAFDPRQTAVFGFADLDGQRKVEQIAPIVAIDGTKDPTDVINRFEELAASLGADLSAPQVTAARGEYGKAVEELKEVTAAKPGLRAVAVGFYDNQIYFARPSQFPGLREFQNAGLDVIEPQASSAPPKVGEFDENVFWDIVSLERVDKYAADLILLDNSADLDREALNRVATWRSLPAVQAGQIVSWRKLESWSYQYYTKANKDLVEGVRRANPALV